MSMPISSHYKKKKLAWVCHVKVTGESQHLGPLTCFERWVWTDAHLLSRPPEVFAGRSDTLQLSSDVKPFNGLQPARSNDWRRFCKTLPILSFQQKTQCPLHWKFSPGVVGTVFGQDCVSTDKRLQLPLITCFKNTTLNLTMSKT